MRINGLKAGSLVAFAGAIMATWWLLAAPRTESASTPTTVTATAGTPTGGPFQPTIENAKTPPAAPPPGMVWIPGGEFSMGAAESPT